MTQKEQVSRRMKACVSKNSTIELALRKSLWMAGYRYRVNYAKLPGKPDLAFTKLKIAVFCDGEFWHGKDWERRRNDFKTNKQFWIDKIERNMARDQTTNERLNEMGWLALRFWEGDIRKRVDWCIATIEEAIRSRSQSSSSSNSSSSSSDIVSS